MDIPFQLGHQIHQKWAPNACLSGRYRYIGGCIMVHGIDLLQYIMGPVNSVVAHERTLVRDIEVEDTASALLEFKNGARYKHLTV